MKNRKQNTYLGVTQNRERIKNQKTTYLARVVFNGVRKQLGVYDKEEDAATAYDKQKIANGELYKLNLPNSPQAVAARAAASGSTSTATDTLSTPATITQASALRGVTRSKYQSKTSDPPVRWHAHIYKPNTNRKTCLGTFNSEQDAGIAYEVAYAALHPGANTADIVSKQMDLLSISKSTQGAEHETVRSLNNI